MSFGITDNMDDYLPPFRWGSLRASHLDNDSDTDSDNCNIDEYEDMVKAMNSDEEINVDDYPDDFIDPMDMDDSDIQR